MSFKNGGTVGDNGRMARIISAKNLTLEGVGEDATVYGWGFHVYLGAVCAVVEYPADACVALIEVGG